MDSKEPINNDDKAWKKFVSGDESAFEQVFKNYYRSMYGYGLRLCNNPERVKDCIQELFRNIWKRRRELDHIKSSNVYLFVSLRRKILKGERKDKEYQNLDEIEDNMSIHFCKEELIINDEIKIQKKEELERALNQLSKRQKEVVYLHFYNGMSYGEIEKILSINRQSVRNHMYRAMETLRSLLDTEIMKLVISLLITLLLFI